MEQTRPVPKKGMVPVAGYPKYLIHPDGSVFSLYTRRYLTPCLASRAVEKSYYRVGLLDPQGNQKNVLLHRLIALHFLPNPGKERTVNHIDGNKLNNSPENLEWSSYTENIRHAVRLKLNVAKKGMRHHGAKLTDAQVLKIKALCTKAEISQYKIAQMFGVSRSAVLNIHLNNSWKHILIADKMPWPPPQLQSEETRDTIQREIPTEASGDKPHLGA